MRLKDHLPPTLVPAADRRSRFEVLLACLFIQAIALFAQTNTPSNDPTVTIPARLKQANCDAPVTYATNQYLVYCQIRCRDPRELDAAYDALRNLSKCAMTATKQPPMVTVVMVLDPARFQTDQEHIKVVATMDSNQRQIRGKVLQTLADGLLVSEADHVVLVADGPKLVDDDPIAVTGYYIGDYQFTTPQGGQKTVRRYTCDAAKAADYWSSPQKSKPKAEPQSRPATITP